MNRFAIFDLDDTLVDSSGAVDRWFMELAEQRNLGAAGLDYLRAEQRRPVSPRESFQAIIDRFGFSESPDELRGIFLDRVPRLSRTFDGVLDDLRKLRARGWRTALLTNGTEADQQPKMRDGLADLFDVVCFADDEPTRKPDPEIFRLVAEHADTGLDGAWMIGDSLEHDIAGGAAVGMETIWISGGRTLQDGEPVPGRVVTSVAEAFPLLHAAG
ncbi:HAD family hydrolase [Streptomyces sp. NPDC048389]|uniref:HAD family hydrolase n=1 Tax=Streptomyces sp. NPDC048389 TaxID=3154622 RepID=UPI003452F2B8